MALTKPRIIELLLVTTVPTMIVAEQGMPSLWLIVCTVLGGTLAAGGANAINMVVDRDIDRLMERTKNRPLVTGAMTPAGRPHLRHRASRSWPSLFLWATVNLLSAVLAVAACLFYVFVYTLWLKRTSSRNIVIGGAAGAVPTLIGWSSVTGTLDWAPVVLFAIIFYWTPPHFWALAIRYRDDYAAAEVPMLPVVESLRRTSVRILGYTLLLWALTVLFSPVAGMGHLYLGSAVVLGGIFTWYAVRLLRTPDPGPRGGRRPAAPPRSRCGPPRCGCSPGRSPTSRCCSGPWRSTSWCAPDGDPPRLGRFEGGRGFVTRFPRATRPLLQVPRMTVTEDAPAAAPAVSQPTATTPAATGLASILGTGDHKVVGRVWLAASLLHLVIAGAAALFVAVLRIDPADLDNDFFAQAVTLRSIGGTFLFLLPLTIGIATLVVPLQVGAATLAFPRAAAAAAWTYLLGGGLVIGAYAIDGGPFGSDTDGVRLFVVAFLLVLLALAVAWICIGTTVLALRAPGMSLRRVPLFAWSSLVAATVWLLILPVLAGLVLVAYIDLRYGGANGFISGGGAITLYSRISWAFSQPAVYAFAIPVLGFAGVGRPGVHAAPATSSTAPPSSSSAPTACSPRAPGRCRPSAPTPPRGSTRRRGSACPSPILAAGARPRSGSGRLTARAGLAAAGQPAPLRHGRAC